MPTSPASWRLVTSLTLPLVDQGRVVAVIGLDIDLATLRRDAEKAATALYDGQGDIAIVSTAGLLALPWSPTKYAVRPGRALGARRSASS
ncbi:hypothetical protein BGP84_10505 [Pseudomonas putida]|jgi:methyl-accepting chemotaxis protein|uniref:Uncharacterized protein n=1 Tax=Pseudomonas putida TaxID=303 RepID=A0A2S3X3H1_PSEPU|nr:hypothetical protein [Pseudomonas putida]POG10140.1 hypothetical protein BGP84_10505 [Pseudomonas putida]POG16283.1 hypothetical protein BGP85_08995 [Pseudomonas putida]